MFLYHFSEFHHPKLCSYSIKGEGCPRPRCNYPHIRKPQEIKEVPITEPQNVVPPITPQPTQQKSTESPPKQKKEDFQYAHPTTTPDPMQGIIKLLESQTMRVENLTIASNQRTQWEMNYAQNFQNQNWVQPQV